MSKHKTLILTAVEHIKGRSILTQNINPNKVFVAAITMSVSKNANGYTSTAVVTVKDQTGAVKSGATVTGQWSGLTTGTASATTNTSGLASFKSLRTKNRGTFTFTVNSISLAGYTYDAASNLQTSASINTP